MANYVDLDAVVDNSVLQEKVKVAAMVKAERWMEGLDTPTANQLAWARSMLRDPSRDIRGLVWAVVVKNKAAPVENITGASDATVQTHVDSIISQYAELGA